MLRELLISAALLAAAAALRCPSQCVCATGDEYEFTCWLPSANVTITARRNDYVQIDCEGGILNCSEFPSIPMAGNKLLPSIALRSCALPHTLRCLLEKLDASDVNVMTLKEVTTPVTADQFAGLGVTALMMFNSDAQTTIPSDVISSLPSLRHFRLCGANVSLSPHQFGLSTPLRYLELSTDNIQVVPHHAFVGLLDLEVLNLWGNDVVELSRWAFVGLDNLQELNLSNNKLKYIPLGLFEPTPRLRTVDINRNQLSELGEVFTGLEQLEQITISNDIELKLHPRVFASLPFLKTLKLERCFIKTLPADLITNSTAVKTLSIAQNQMEDVPINLLSDQTALETLDLRYNAIKAVTPELFSNLKALQTLKLDGNQIQILPDQLFSGLKNLKSVSISNNKLKTISYYTFQGASELETLVLANNQLSCLPESSSNQYYNLELYSPFNALSKLKHLDLKRNNISKVFSDWTNVLVFMNYLDLSYNQFTKLTITDVQFLSSDITVDLRHNNISSIDLNTEFQLDDYIDKTTTKAEMLLENNPIVCDCHLYAFIRRLHGFKSMAVETKFDVGTTKCASPLDNYFIEYVPDNILVCGFNCTNNCMCNLRPATQILELDCQKDVSLPAPFEFGLVESTLRLHRAPSNLTTLPEYVMALNLSGLGLVELPFADAPKTLKYLDLSDNNLTEVPGGLFNKHLMLKLRGNYFECDCWHAQEIAELVSNRFYIDYENITCTDGTQLSQVDPSRLCDIYRATVVGSLLALLGILIAIFATLLYRYSLEVRVYLFAKGWFRCWLPEEKLDASKKYDVFVSYAHKDEEFVRDSLLPKLESEYKVCVHHRDWVVGDLIPLQIARSVEESRRTVIILSRNFLSSVWGLLEFRSAHVQALKDGRVRVIIVLLEDVTNETMDDEIRAYLSTNTYVKWGETGFWDKLRYALPHGVKAKVIREERKSREMVERLVKGGLDVQLNKEGKLINAAFVKDAV